MNKRIVMTLALTASWLGAQDARVPVADTMKAQVGRNRPITETVNVKSNLVTIVARHPKAGCLNTAECGEVFYKSTSHNLVTNAGLNWLADIMSNTSTPSVNAQCNWIGLSSGTGTPLVTDTALATSVGTELTTNGMARNLSIATYTHSANATTYTIGRTFTATGTVTSVQAGGVFTANAAGTMCFEDVFTPATLSTSDTLSVVWTVTI